jgi:hypothetical protein
MRLAYPYNAQHSSKFADSLPNHLRVAQRPMGMITIRKSVASISRLSKNAESYEYIHKSTPQHLPIVSCLLPRAHLEFKHTTKQAEIIRIMRLSGIC